MFEMLLEQRFVWEFKVHFIDSLTFCPAYAMRRPGPVGFRLLFYAFSVLGVRYELKMARYTELSVSHPKPLHEFGWTFVWCAHVNVEHRDYFLYVKLP